MFSIIKRRFEIVGYTISEPGKLPVGYFADMFGVDDITIKRDLNALRKKGIDIHSVNNQGLIINGRIEPATLRSLIPQYVGIAYSIIPYHNATDHLINIKGAEAVKIFTIIQKAIENSNMVVITRTDPHKELYLRPVNIYQNEQQWHLVGKENDYLRVIEIAKIIEIEPIKDYRERQFADHQLSDDHERFGIISRSSVTLPLISKEKFVKYKAKDIIRDDRIDRLIDIKIDDMLHYLRGQVQEDYERTIHRVLDRFRDENGEKKEVSIPELLEVLKKFLS